MSVRIQRQRTKGWRMPEGAVYVGRPSRWGNPFPLSGDWMYSAAIALGHRPDADGIRCASVDLFRWWVTSVMPHLWSAADAPIQITAGTRGGAAWHRGHGVWYLPLCPEIAHLRGHDLACWCPLDQLCHADVLLELA
jgi:hypothetical protein